MDRPPVSGEPSTELTTIAAEILRFTGGCEKPHRNGEANPHVHHEVTHRWGQRLAVIAAEARATPPSLDVERRFTQDDIDEAVRAALEEASYGEDR